MMKQYFDNDILLSEVAGLLCEGKTVTIPVRGNSMRPFLADGRDSVVLQRGEAGRLKPGDVVLATVRGGQTWVLHRIVARRGNHLTLQGDNNRETEAAEVKDVAGVAIATAVSQLLSAVLEAGFDYHALPVVMMGGGASVVSRHIRPSDGLCRTVTLLDDRVNAQGYERAAAALWGDDAQG